MLRRFKRFTQPQPKKRGRAPLYHPGLLLKPLSQISRKANLPCSKRLKALLPLWLPGYVESFAPLSPQTLRALHRISTATIDRLLRPVRVQYQKRGRTTTKPGTLLRKHIPIQTNQWDQSRPGFLQTDTVAHREESLCGIFAYTIDCVDIATGWPEQRAVWGQGESDVLQQIKDIETSLPFPLLGSDCDNGSEFLNHHLFRHFTQRKQPIQFTRTQTYHKDDNAHVEQKN